MTQAIDPTNSAIMYTEYYGGNDIYRSMDAFNNSTNISDNIDDNPSGEWVTPFVLNPWNPKTMLIGFHDIYRTFDRGDSFHKISENLTGSVDNKIRVVEIAPSDTNIIVATWKNKLYRTIDGGAIWKTSNAVGTSDDITGVAINPSNPERIWLTKGGLSAGKKVYLSPNGGQNWTNISGGLPNVPANCILYDSVTNYLFIGTDIGVFYSDATTISWQPYGTGLPNVFVLDFALRKVNRRLYIATHGRGVYSVPLEDIVATHTLPDAAAQVQVFPNPGNTSLYFNALDKSAITAEAKMYNANGQLVLRQAIRNLPLDQVILHQLANGVYFLQIQDNGHGGLLVQKRVVVQH